MMVRWDCDVRGSSLSGSDYVTVLWKETGGVPIGCKDDDRRLDLSTIGIDSI